MNPTPKPKITVRRTPKDGSPGSVWGLKEAALWLRDRGYYRSQTAALKALQSGVTIQTMFAYFELEESP